jgi:hypothetical protein
VEYLIYLHHFFGIKEKSGVRIVSNSLEMSTGANVEEAYVARCLNQLCKHGIVKKLPDGYLISDEQALVEYIPVLKERAAA